MTLDKKSLDRLLSLDDDRLRILLGRLLAEYGVDTSVLPLQSLNLDRLRDVLRGATDQDIARFLQLMKPAESGHTSGGGEQ